MSSSSSSSSELLTPQDGTQKKADEQDEKAFLLTADEPLAHSIMLGCITGTVCVCVGYPLDTMKVRLQNGQLFSRGMFSSLYRGISAPLMAVVPSWAATFFIYGSALKVLGDDSLMSCAMAGAVAGWGYSLVICPFEFLKCNVQCLSSNAEAATGQTAVNAAKTTSGGAAAGTAAASTGVTASTAMQNATNAAKSIKPPISMTQFMKETIANRGYLGLYRGYTACLGRDLGQNAMYYLAAEYLNRKLVSNSILGPTWAPFAAGAMTGICHCTVEYPFDCVKTRKQTAPDPLVLRALGRLGASGSGGVEAKNLNGSGTAATTAAGSSTFTSYGEIMRTIGTDNVLKANLARGYCIWISRAVLAHSAAFGVLNLVRPYLYDH